MLPPPLDTWCGETSAVDTLTQDDDDDVSLACLVTLSLSEAMSPLFLSERMVNV